MEGGETMVLGRSSLWTFLKRLWRRHYPGSLPATAAGMFRSRAATRRAEHADSPLHGSTEHTTLLRCAQEFTKTIPEGTISPKWQATLAHQVETLELLLRRVTDIAESIRSRQGLEASQKAQLLRELASEANQLLDEQVAHTISLEREIEEIKVSYGDEQALSPEVISHLHALEQVNYVLHANLVIARQRLNAIIQP